MYKRAMDPIGVVLFPKVDYFSLDPVSVGKNEAPRQEEFDHVEVWVHLAGSDLAR